MKSPVGSDRFRQLDLQPSDSAVPGALTSEAEDTTLRYTRGYEAEMLIDEIIVITDKLISFLGKEFGYGRGEAQ